MRRKGREVAGTLLVDKPAGITSNRALQQVKRIFTARKAGHTGTLDPFATGLLVIRFGEATKFSQYLIDADKSYEARLELGERTDTGDRDGEVVERSALPQMNETGIQAVLDAMLGEQQQIPPMYSALKVGGRPLYEIARAGGEVARAARCIQIHSCELLGWSADYIDFAIRCSKGTYVRTVGEEIAARLGTVGHLTALRRTRSGQFDITDAVGIEQLEAASDFATLDGLLQAVDAGLEGLQAMLVDKAQSDSLIHGQAVKMGDTVDMAGLQSSASDPAAPVRLYENAAHRFLGLGRVVDGMLMPYRMMASGSR